MELFVLTGVVTYEGSDVLGVYSTREAAVEAATSFEAESDLYDSYQVRVHSLDRSAEPGRVEDLVL